MKTTSRSLIVLTAAAMLAATAAVNASDFIITAASGPGSFNTTLGGTSVMTFDNLNTGVNNNVSWSGVGTFDSLNIKNADQYGGANGTRYAVEGLGVVPTTTLSLNQSSSYFGMWWSAGDAANQLNFYKSGSLVASFDTANLMSQLSSAYNGNPNSGTYHGQDSGEKFGFINFIGDATTSWDQIQFSNNAGSGFEADNYTSRVAGWNPATDGTIPGTPVLELKNGVYSNISSVPAGFAAAPSAPAPPMTACLAFAGVLVLQALRRKRSA